MNSLLSSLKGLSKPNMVALLAQLLSGTSGGGEAVDEDEGEDEDDLMDDMRREPSVFSQMAQVGNVTEEKVAEPVVRIPIDLTGDHGLPAEIKEATTRGNAQRKTLTKLVNRGFLNMKAEPSHMPHLEEEEDVTQARNAHNAREAAHAVHMAERHLVDGDNAYDSDYAEPEKNPPTNWNPEFYDKNPTAVELALNQFFRRPHVRYLYANPTEMKYLFTFNNIKLPIGLENLQNTLRAACGKKHDFPLWPSTM